MSKIKNEVLLGHCMLYIPYDLHLVAKRSMSNANRDPQKKSALVASVWLGYDRFISSNYSNFAALLLCLVYIDISCDLVSPGTLVSYGQRSKFAVNERFHVSSNVPRL